MDFSEFDASPQPQQQQPQIQQPPWALNLFNQIAALFVGQTALAIHRSKICALFDDLRSFMRTFDPDPNLDQATIQSACAEFVDTLGKIKSIAYASSNQKWTTAICRWKHNTVYDAIRTYRETLSRIVHQFGCHNATEFMISDADLNAQNDSDILQLKGAMMDYQANLLPKANNPQVAQVIQIIDNRIQSIGPIEGISDGPGISKIPSFLPAKLKLEKIHSEFVVGDTIGSGAFASVHNGTLRGFPKKVAIKMLNKKVLGGRQLETFKREVWTLASFDHPSILKLLGVTFTPPFCIITEMLKTSLDKRMRFLTPTRRSVVVERVALGMAQLHAKHVIHRDLKAANILLDEDDMPRICDFGLVGFKRTGTPHTGFVGTIQWMAPELLRSNPYYDEKVDVYSFAIMLYEILAMKEPYLGMSQDMIVMGVIERGLRPEMPSHFGPPALIDLIEQCWAENPAERPSFDQIAYLLMQPEYHFTGTNEAEFKRDVPPPLFSQEIQRAFDNEEWNRIDNLLSQVNKSNSQNDEELVKVVLDVFWASDNERKNRIIQNLSSMFDMEKFLSSGGYSFVVKAITDASSQNNFCDLILRTLSVIPLNSQAFRQGKLISALSESENPTAQYLLAELCKYLDIASFVCRFFVPLKTETPGTLLIYSSLMAHDDFRLHFATQSHMLEVALKLVEDSPKEACGVFALYPFGPSHMKFVDEYQIISALVKAATQKFEQLALPAFQHIIAVAPVELIAKNAEGVSILVSQYKQMYGDNELMGKLKQISQIRIIPTEPPPQMLERHSLGNTSSPFSASNANNASSSMNNFSQQNQNQSASLFDDFSMNSNPPQSQPQNQNNHDLSSLIDF